MQFKSFSVGIGGCIALKELSLHNCTSLALLTCLIWVWPALRRLWAVILHSPDSTVGICNLVNLKELDVSYTAIQALPDGKQTTKHTSEICVDLLPKGFGKQSQNSTD